MYIPTQPEMAINSSGYREIPFDTTKETGISLFYQFKKSGDQDTVLPVIPDGCMDILFGLSSSDPVALIAASPTERRYEGLGNNKDFFGIRLTPDQHLLPLTCSIKELIQEKILPLKEVCSFDNASIEKIASLSSLEERKDWFLSSCLSDNQLLKYDDNLIKYCLDRIYLSKGMVTVKELEVETGYTARYLRKKFDEHIGFSPKQFCQIVRLQYSVGNMVTSSNLSSLVEDYGYYDKAHFYKEFKKYMNLTPKQYQEIICL